MLTTSLPPSYLFVFQNEEFEDSDAVKKVRTTPSGAGSNGDAATAPQLLAAPGAPNAPGLIWALAAPGSAAAAATAAGVAPSAASAAAAAQRLSAFMPWNVGKDGKATIAISAQE